MLYFLWFAQKDIRKYFGGKAAGSKRSAQKKSKNSEKVYSITNQLFLNCIS